MFDLLKLRKSHGYQAIPDILKATLPEPFRGFPLLNNALCSENCQACVHICPTHAISTRPLKMDLGACIFCGECAQICPTQAIRFSSAYCLGSTQRTDLIVSSGLKASDYEKTAIQVRKKIKQYFGKSLKLRQVSAGGCSGCELELNASNNVNFDMSRFGIDFVASPRHADGLVITGPITENMAPALHDTWVSIASPRLVITVGACAISGGLFTQSEAVNRTFFDKIPVDLYIPGCPTHPLTFIHAVLAFLGQKKPAKS